MSAVRSVFIVEDSLPVQSALKEMIESVGGWQVVGIAGGETQATDWLHKHRRQWDVAVLDLLLQEGSGFGLIQRCRSEHPKGRIVVFSEYATPALKDKCISIGANAVFLKSELPQFVAYLEGVGDA
jgi:two-component system OmpR family response regulator